MGIKIHTVDHELKFGKYKGQLLQEVIAADPNWVIWAIENVDHFDVDENAESILQDFVEDDNPDEF